MKRDLQPDSLRNPVQSPQFEILEQVPIGLAILHLRDPENPRSWTVLKVNSLATFLVGDSISDFLSGPLTNNVPAGKIERLYREVVISEKKHLLGVVDFGHGAAMKGYHLAKIVSLGSNCIAVTLEDANMYVRARKALHEAEANLNQYARADAILWRAEIDTLRFSFVSKEAENILGYWTEHWRSETSFWRNHVVTEDWPAIAACCQTAQQENKTQKSDFRMMSVEGKVLWFETTVRVSDTPNGRKELVGVMINITERKRAEEAARQLAAQILTLQDEERRRMSRELHDSLGQLLAALKMNLDTLIKDDSRYIEPILNSNLIQSQDLVEQAIREVRTMTYLLHPPMLDEAGLSSALAWYVEGFSQRSGIRVDLNVSATLARLPARMETAIFRITQEALTNVHRHSGSKIVDIRISDQQNKITLEIADQGVGLPSHIQQSLKTGGGGVGLRGMSERVHELNGAFEIDSSKNGTILRVTFPQIETSKIPNQRPGLTKESNGKQASNKSVAS